MPNQRAEPPDVLGPIPEVEGGVFWGRIDVLVKERNVLAALLLEQSRILTDGPPGRVALSMPALLNKARARLRAIREGTG
jgi:hypothetical protein